MRTQIKCGFFGIGLLLAVLCLSGCGIGPTINPATLTIAVSPDSGHPPFDISIAAACSESGGTYTLSVNGVTIELPDGRFSGTIYTWPWTATVIWTGEGKTVEGKVEVTLENAKPVAHSLWFLSTDFSDREIVPIDLRYTQHGCSGRGGELLKTGIEDPDYTANGPSQENDNFLYRVEVIDAVTGVRESIFYGPDRTVLFPGDYVSTTAFTWIVNYFAYTAPFPFSTEGGVSLTEKREKYIHVYVREWGIDYHWVYSVFASPPRNCGQSTDVTE